MEFRQKPIIIEAVQFTGNNSAECMAFCPVAQVRDEINPCLIIRTEKWYELCPEGDWIIKDIRGEFFPCRKDLFEMRYEPVPAQKKISR